MSITSCRPRQSRIDTVLYSIAPCSGHEEFNSVPHEAGSSSDASYSRESVYSRSLSILLIASLVIKRHSMTVYMSPTIAMLYVSSKLDILGDTSSEFVMTSIPVTKDRTMPMLSSRTEASYDWRRRKNKLHSCRRWLRAHAA